MTEDPDVLSPVEVLLFSSHGSKNDNPQKLLGWWRKGLSKADLRRVICKVWVEADSPTRDVSEADWLEMFRAAGYIAPNDEPRPTAPIEVFRGTSREHRCGMSWTRDLDRARWHAAGHRQRNAPSVVVLRCFIEPTAILALPKIDGCGYESEVIVDPSLLPLIDESAILD